MKTTILSHLLDTAEGLSASEKLVLCALAFKADETGRAICALEDLARISVPVSTLCRALNELRRRGLVISERGDFGPSEYWIVPADTSGLADWVERAASAGHPAFGPPRALRNPTSKRRLSKAERVAHAAWGGRCAYCGGPAITTDHVTPRSRGGLDEPGNLLPACLPCNASKGNRSLEEFLEGNPGRVSEIRTRLSALSAGEAA